MELEETSPNQENSNILHPLQSILLTKLSFNLIKGHYNFVYELLRQKCENFSTIGIEANSSEGVTNQKLWVQFETNKQNKKFLHGKTPLILCAYIKENDWATFLARMFLESGAHLSLRDATNGFNALHYACAFIKTDLIQLFLQNLDSSILNTLDFNGNTPLVYFFASFGLYLDRALSDPSNNIKNKNAAKHQEKFEAKAVQTLRFYLEYLKENGLRVNTMNRLGIYLFDIYNYFVSYNKNLKNHDFFYLIKSSLENEFETGNSVFPTLGPIRVKYSEIDNKKHINCNLFINYFFESLVSDAVGLILK